MKLADWAHIAEIMAFILVTVSLVYVGLEVRQNTAAVQNESHQNIISMLNDQQMALSTNKELHRIFMTAETSPEKLTAEEWSRFVQFMYPRIGVWEYLFIAKQQGSITDTVWTAFEPYYLSIICKPGYRRWWKEYGQSNAPDFIKYVEEQVLPTCNGG